MVDVARPMSESRPDRRAVPGEDGNRHALPPARVVIEAVTPDVDGGRFPAKATVGEDVTVEADIFTDGTDVISAVVLHRAERQREWAEAPMTPLDNDRWRGSVAAGRLGLLYYAIEAWVDPFLTWRRDLARRLEARQALTVELQVGAALVAEAAERAAGKDREALVQAAKRLASGEPERRRARFALQQRLADLMGRYCDRTHATRFPREVQVRVEPRLARFSAWYEMFPRSVWEGYGDSVEKPQATLRDVEARLPYLAAAGFDVLYLPPVHPIGRTHRKGPNNMTEAGPEDPGSPWAIGSEKGGHKAINPDLGTLADLRRLVRTARKQYGIEVALDLAYQCSPDHPYAREHPEWFRHRPDGSIRYAENPPKKYEDIYPFDFGTADRQGLWDELKSIVEFWVAQGVRVFRVDNPHTKPFAFWEWMIGAVKQDHPEVIFLAEAFTRPKVMYRLAKLGFSQSYTYFAWRNQKWDLSEYMTELTSRPVRDFFRPNFWPNTPDILTETLQHGGRPAFVARLVLAATMSSNYGVFGPAFELMESTPREPGSEEYLHSEKYEVRRWDVDRPGNLRDVMALVNTARRENRALQSNRNLRFHHIDNDRLIAYSKHTDDLTSIVLIVVNLDDRCTQSGWLYLPADDWQIAQGDEFRVEDTLSGAVYTWRPGHNFVQLDPHAMPAHVFVIKRPAGTQRQGRTANARA